MRFQDRALIALPVASFTWIVSSVTIAGALRPGYRHSSQFISELGATGTPGSWAMNMFGFLPTEILFFGFLAMALLRTWRDPAMLAGLLALAGYAGSLTIAAFYACDAGCRPVDPSEEHMIHIISGLGAYLFAITGIVILALRCGRAGARGLRWSGLAVAVLALAPFANLTPDNPLAGLCQRALETLLYLWIIAFAVYLARRRART